MDNPLMQMLERRALEVEQAPLLLKAEAAHRFSRSAMAVLRDLCNRIEALERPHEDARRRAVAAAAGTGGACA